MTTIAYAGESTTAMTNSWLYNRPVAPDLTIIGGYAHGGYTTEQVLANIDAGINADVLTIMLGTNDQAAAHLYTNTRSRTAIEAIATKAGGKQVLLATIPPCSITNDNGINRMTAGAIWNRYLITIAYENGWLYVDPSAQFRQLNGAYAAGTCDTDQVHPTTASYTLMGARMDAYMRMAGKLAA